MCIIRLIFRILLLLVLLFSIWFIVKFLIANRNSSDGSSNAEKQRDTFGNETSTESTLPEKFLSLIVRITKDEHLDLSERNLIYDELRGIAQILKDLEDAEIPVDRKYEIEKLSDEYLQRLISSYLSLDSSERNFEKLKEGLTLIRAELQKIKDAFDSDSKEFKKEVEFLKRKYGGHGE
ncbi:MAG: hypothetical protein ABGX27_03925 [Desulfurobacteriaceae bacterium]